jgi:SAM-dependent methyltransferase
MDSLVGCGNGHLLRLLARAGYTDLTGLDYSEASIEVATAIAAKYGDVVKFETRDLFDARKEGAEVYHVALDKGTLDGISLSAEEKEGVPLATLYPGKMSEMVGPGGIVLITSCKCRLSVSLVASGLTSCAGNFTRPELEKRFITPETGTSSLIPSSTVQLTHFPHRTQISLADRTADVLVWWIRRTDDHDNSFFEVEGVTS